MATRLRIAAPPFAVSTLYDAHVRVLAWMGRHRVVCQSRSIADQLWVFILSYVVLAAQGSIMSSIVGQRTSLETWPGISFVGTRSEAITSVVPNGRHCYEVMAETKLNGHCVGMWCARRRWAVRACGVRPCAECACGGCAGRLVCVVIGAVSARAWRRRQ